MSNPNTVTVSQVSEVTVVEITTAGAQGETGAQGPTGATGPSGANGSATVSIGTTSTGNAGTNAAITNTGTGTAAVLNFTIPRGATGATGPAGADGNDGADGNNGATGSTGPQGSAGATGATGAAATIAVGTVTTGATGSSATVTNSGSSSAATFDFSIPRGATGATGSTGSQGATGSQGPAGNDGSDGSDATVNATNVDNAGAVMNSDLDGKGELLVGDGSGDPTALAAGTNGYVLKANSSTATGLEWSAAGSGGDVNQNAFSNVAVSGQDTVAADSTTDTLNIAAGSNVTITTNASNDTVTIASTDTNTTYSVGDGGLTQNNFTNTLKTKLDGIEASATADQTNAEIRTAVEAAIDSNVFTDADHSKLNAIEASATADQTAAEIRTLVESASDSNVFTDADHTKLNGIEASATADQTDAEIRAAVEAATDSNVFTDADHTKLNGIETSATADQTASEIKTLLQSDKLTVNEIADDAVTADKLANSINTEIAANTAKVTNATHTGDVTGATALTIANDAVTTDKINLISTSSVPSLEAKGDGSSQDGYIQLNCSQNSHGVKIKSPPHSANASYTLTLPNTDGNANQVLKTDGSGDLDWVDQTTDTNTQLSNAEVRTAVEAASDSNVFTDADHTKLDGLVSNATHTGEVTGSTALTIADNVVDEANLKVSNSPTDGYVLTAQSGNTGGLTWAEASGGGGGGGLSSDAQGNTVGGSNAGDSFDGTNALKNTLIGYNAGTALETGDENTFLGYDAGAATTAGAQNTFIGYNSGKSNINSQQCVAVGANSLASQTNTSHNGSSTVGHYSLYSQTTGKLNTALGRYAGYNVTTGEENIFIGNIVGYGSITTGDNNIIIGSQATASSATVNNEITLGNSSTSTLRCNTQTISSLSDERDKTDINTLDLGLNFVKSLNPVKFKWKTRDGNGKDGSYEAGFIAQDFQQLQKNNKADYLGLVIDENPNRLEASYGKLVPILVRAIQELTIEVETLKQNG